MQGAPLNSGVHHIALLIRKYLLSVQKTHGNIRGRGADVVLNHSLVV